MGQTIESLVVRLEADIQKYEAAMRKLPQITGTSVDGMVQRHQRGAKLSQDAWSGANDNIGKGMSSVQAKADALRASLDPLIAAQQRHAQAMGEAKALLGAGAISFDTYTAAVKRADMALKEVASSSTSAGGSLNRMQMLELAHSARAMADGLAAGQNPLRLLAMEGGRVTQALGSGEGGVMGALKGMGSGLASLAGKVPPVAYAIAAVVATIGGLVAAAAKFGSEEASLGSSLRTYGGGASGDTAGQLNAIADAAAKAGDGTRSFEIEAVNAFTRAGVAGENIRPALDIVADFAALTGEKTPDALKKLAAALTDPGEGMKKLREAGVDLTDQQIQAVKQMEILNGKAAAQQLALKYLQNATKDYVSNSQNWFQNFFHQVHLGFDGMLADIGRATSAMLNMGTATVKMQRLQDQKINLEAQLKGNTTDPTGRVDMRAALEQQLKGVNEAIGKMAADPSYKAEVKTAGDRARSRVGQDNAELLNKVDPIPEQIKTLKTEREAFETIIKKAKGGDASVLGGKSIADYQKGIDHANREIKSLEKRDSDKPTKTKRGPADTTVAEDNKTQNDLQAARKDLTAAIKEGAAAERAHTSAVTTLGVLAEKLGDAEAEEAAKNDAITADLNAKLTKLAQDEAKIRAAKNDKNKAAELATIEQTRATLEEAAVQKRITAEEERTWAQEKAIREAHLAEIDDAYGLQKKVLDLKSNIDSIKAGYANSTDTKLAADLQRLADQKASADLARKHDYDKAVGGLDPNAPGYDQKAGRLKADYETDQNFADHIYGLQTAKTRFDDVSPLQKWTREATKDAGQVQDALENAAVKGLDDFNSGLAEAIVNGKSLGDTMSSIFKNMEAQLIQYLAKQAEIGIVNAVTGGTGGGFFSFLTGGHAGGTDFSSGGLKMVGEAGPELIAMPRGAQVLPNNLLRNIGKAGSTMAGMGTPTINVPVVVNAPDAMTREWVQAYANQAAYTGTLAAIRQTKADLAQAQSRTFLR